MVASTFPMPRHERGLIGARRRWGEPRIARLDSLSGPQRQLIMALIGQMTKKDATEISRPVASKTAEDTSDDSAA